MQRTTWTPWRTFNKKVKQSWWCEDKSECLRDVREAELFWSVGDLINITMWILFAWWTVTYNFVTAQWQICMFYSNILIHVKVSWREIRSKDDVLWIPPLLQLCTVFVFEISRYGSFNVCLIRSQTLRIVERCLCGLCGTYNQPFIYLHLFWRVCLKSVLWPQTW